MRRPNDTDNLHKLTRSYPALTASFFVFFFYKYQNTLDPTQNFFKKIRVEKTPITLKHKSICFKIQRYFDNFIVLEKRKNQKSSSPKVNRNSASKGI